MLPDVLYTDILPDDYLPILEKINDIVRESGAPIEGNLFYEHHAPVLSFDTITPRFSFKRRNFALLSSQSTRMLEIGVNAGHSALLALSRGVDFHGVDICIHPYTKPVAEFLKWMFGDRFHFYEGDSLEVLPDLYTHRPDLKFDCLHVDGHHGFEFCQADTYNSYKLATKDAWILIDDTDYEYILAFYNAEVAAGRIAAVAPEGWVNIHSHKVGIIK